MAAPAFQQLDVVVFGEPVIRRRFDAVADALVDATPAMREIGRLLEEESARNFQSQGSSSGPKWEDLAPSTLAAKARSGLNSEVLYATGRLYDSLTRDSPSSDAIREYGPDSIDWGSRVPYGVFHQSRKPRTRLPFRPPTRMPADIKRQAVRELQRVVMGAARAAA